METNLITEALKFMVLGMGIVFVFLIVMINALKIQARIIGRIFPEKETATKTITKTTNNQTAKIAAIVATIQHHKNLKG